MRVLEPGDQGGARPEGGREAPALGAGRALPGGAPRAGPPTGESCPAGGRTMDGAADPAGLLAIQRTLEYRQVRA